MNVILKASSNKDNARTQVNSAPKKGTKSYLSEVKDELKKISWPKADELKICTKVVIASTFVFGFGIYIADLLVKGTLDGLSIFFRLVFG